LDASITATRFLVTEDDSSIVLTTANQGSRTTATATLTDSDSGLGLAARTVHFLLEGREVATAVTDSAGNAVVTFSTKKVKKDEIVRAVFDGDGYYAGSSAEHSRNG
jgi:hypothetical protein